MLSAISSTRSMVRGLAAILLTLGTSAGLWPNSLPDSRFGIVEAYEVPLAAEEAGAGWERVRLNWADLQPDGPGQGWRFQDWTEAQLVRERAEGREIVGLLIGVPAWARD